MPDRHAVPAPSTDPAYEPRPDHMGVWSESGDLIWLPREHYPKHSDAIAFAVAEWGATWIEVRCRARFMRYDPYIAYHADGSEAWRDDLWSECPHDSRGAF